MTESPLDRFARRAGTDPAFLGAQLAAFARARGFDDDALAAHLGCDRAALTNVRLCGAIRPAHFRADVTEVATRFGLNATRLAEAAKPLPAEPRAADPGPDVVHATGGVMLAARDRADQS